MRNRFVFYEDVNKTPVRAAGHLYSTRSKAEYTYKQPVATRHLGKRASPPSYINTTTIFKQTRLELSQTGTKRTNSANWAGSLHIDSP